MNNLIQARRYLVDLLKDDPSNEVARTLLNQLDTIAQRYITKLVDMVENELT